MRPYSYIHLLKASALDQTEICFPKYGTNTVEKISYNGKNQEVFINKEQYFEGISKEVWEYRIGAYQVLHFELKIREKWRTFGYLARTTFHGKYSYVADIVQLCQDFRGEIIEGIKEIPIPRMAKSGQKGYFYKWRFLYQTYNFLIFHVSFCNLQ